MRITIITALIWMGLLTANSLHAKDLLTGDTFRGSEAVAAMQEDSTDFGVNDTVFIPFGKSVRKFTAGAITVLDPKESLKYDNITGIYSAVDGFVPGSFGGLNVRGLGDALVVIDGIPRPIGSVNIEEVEQITVLKDVNASVLYGVQGNTGLILVKTKRGTPNVRKVNFTVEQGTNRPISLPKYLNSADYMTLYNEARLNDGLTALYTQDQIAKTKAGTFPAMYPDADYYSSEFLKDSKPYTRVVGQFSGGNQNAQYYLSTGYSHSGTLVNMGEGKKERDDRLNVRSNVNFKITDFIRSYVDVVAIWDITRRANGNYWSNASNFLPNLYTPLIDTSLVTDKKYVPTATLINGKYMIGGRTGYTTNVWADLNLAGHYTQVNTSVQFNNGIDFDLKGITQGLTFKTFIGFDFYNQFRETQTNTYAVYQPVWSQAPDSSWLLSLNKIGVDQFTGTQGVSNSVLQRNLGVYGLLDYSRVFGIHGISASLLAYAENYTQTAVLQPEKNAHLGLRVNYVNNNKYIVDFSSALVSSSKLYEDNRVGLSPSLGLGWIISEEDFMGGASFIDFLKLRLSASALNTDRTIPGYYYYEGIYLSGSSFGWNDGSRSLNASQLSTEKNYDLFYQVRREINGGLEAVMFNNSLWVDANIFRERNTDMVVQRTNSYPAFLGSFYPYENYGEEKYTGFEIGATWRKAVSTDLSVELGANMVYVTSEVVKRDERWEYDYLYRAGKPVSAMFGLEAIGFFRDSADVANSWPQAFGTVSPGDLKYKDQNGDSIIDSNDQVEIAQSAPKIAGGINVLIRYKNFSLFGLATGRSGGERYFNNAYYWVYSTRKYSEEVLDRWTPATASSAGYPRLTTQTSNNNFQSSDFWLRSNSMFSIDRLQLSYDIPTSLSSKLAMKNLNVYVRASNIALFSKSKEQMQLNIGSEPQYRYYGIGLKATF